MKKNEQTGRPVANKPWEQKLLNIMQKIWFVLKLTAKWAYDLRSLVLSIPVVVCAGALAIRNARLLPEMVGINMMANGTYRWVVSRGVAVTAPLGITILCVVLMLCSKKMTYPWLISVFSLLLPLVLWFTNMFSV